MKQKDLVFVDLDGTILDYKLRAYKTFVEIVGERGQEELTFEDYVQRRRSGVSNFELFTGLSMWKFDESTFHTKWMLLIEEIDFLSHDELFSDTLDWIYEHDDRAHLVLCTARRIKVNLIRQLKSLYIFDAFQELLVSEGRFSKHELLNSYLEDSQHLNKNMYFLGDTLNDMLAGKSIGAKVFFIERGFTSSLYLAGTQVDSITRHLPRIPH